MKTALILACVFALPAGPLLAEEEKPETPLKEPAKEEPAKKDPAKAEPDATKPDTLVGLPLAEAEALADKAKIAHRVVSVDGQLKPTTRDLRPDRLNFTVEKGKVTKVTKG